MTKSENPRNSRVTIRASVLLVIILLLLFEACSLHKKPEAFPTATGKKQLPLIRGSRVQNIIFLIGDGMGISQISAARIKKGGAMGRLHLETMPVTGLMNTHSAKQLITDSAASGTAMATGYKTVNGAISVLPDGLPVQTILEKARLIGKATGLVATSRITHATPAAFAAHVRSRSSEAEIATHIIETGVDIILGGGRDYFIPSTIKGSSRKDDRHLLDLAHGRGYSIVTSKEELENSSSNRILGLFQLGPLTTTEPDEPSLEFMTGRAIEVLNRNKKGFFLMVEGSQIDWRSHSNDPDGTIRQMLLFDDAVKVALDFALNDGKTLVVVTGDHETGGMSITGGTLSGRLLKIDWTTTGHTATPLPLYAFGPAARRFTGVMDNTEIPIIFARLWGVRDFPERLDQKQKKSIE